MYFSLIFLLTFVDSFSLTWWNLNYLMEPIEVGALDEKKENYLKPDERLEVADFLGVSCFSDNLIDEEGEH